MKNLTGLAELMRTHFEERGGTSKPKPLIQMAREKNFS